MSRFNADTGMLRWKEPAAFKRARARRDGIRPNRWYPPLLVLAIVVVCLSGAAFHNNPAFGSWPVTVALAVGIGVMLGYGAPFVASRDPNVIAITDRGFGRRSISGIGASLQCWPWEQVTDCRMESMTLEGQSYKVLVVHTRIWEPVEFALSDSMNVDDVAAAIAAHGRTLRIDEREVV